MNKVVLILSFSNTRTQIKEIKELVLIIKYDCVKDVNGHKMNPNF